MDISEVKNIVDQVFSDDGFKFLNFFVSCPKSFDMKLNKDKEGINIDFSKDMPHVRTKKFLIPVTVYIEGVFLGASSGSIKLKYFPDIHFDYETFSEERFGSTQRNINLDSFNNQINKQFADEERRKIAKIALQYANEWATIVSQAGVNVRDCEKIDRAKLRKDCENFVLDNIRNSKEIEAKSAILSFILLYFVLPAVISWVVKKFLDNFFN